MAHEEALVLTKEWDHPPYFSYFLSLVGPIINHEQPNPE